MNLDRGAAAEELWGRIIGFAEGLADADWERPTPCEGWSVKDLLGHCSGIQVGFDTGTFLPPPDGWAPPQEADPRDQWTAAGVAARRDWTRSQVLDELEAARQGHVDRLGEISDWSAETDGPVGRTTEAGLFDIRCFDLWVHLQDLRVAVDEPVDVDDGSAAAVRCHHFVLARVPWMLGKRAGAPDGARLRLSLSPPLDEERCVVMRDGRAAFTDAADADDAANADDAVDAAPAALTLLASGRRSAEQWRAEDLLGWQGPVAEAFVQRGRLF